MAGVRNTTAGDGVLEAENECSTSAMSEKASQPTRLSVFERAVLDAMERLGAETVIGVFGVCQFQAETRFSVTDKLRSVPLEGHSFLILSLSRQPLDSLGNPAQGYISTTLAELRRFGNGD